jgi:hypothetical protein
MQANTKCLIVFITLIAFGLFNNNLNAESSSAYQAICKAVASNKAESVACETSISGSSDTALIGCRIIDSCELEPRSNSDLSFVCPYYPEVSHLCEPNVDNQGKTTWFCKGWIGTSMGARDDVSLTEKEFLDLSARCSRMCGDCSSGWK